MRTGLPIYSFYVLPTDKTHLTIGDDRYQGVRHALISKMAMPEEILVEKDNRTGLCASHVGARKFNMASVRRRDHHAHQNQRH